MINFDNPPQASSGFSLLPAGFYKATIEKAVMKQPAAEGKKPFLNLTLKLSDDTGSKGLFFDAFFDSTADVCVGKVIRFCKAIGLNLTGQLELPDILKLIQTGKQFCIETTIQKDKQPPHTERAVARVFGSETYWPIEAWADLKAVGGAASAEPSPFDFGADEDEPTEEAKY